jgi:hypothetical protein
VLQKAELSAKLIQRTTSEAPQRHMYFIGLDVHKKTITDCVKDAAGSVHQEGKIGSTRRNWTAGFGPCRSPARSRWKRRSLPGGTCLVCRSRQQPKPQQAGGEREKAPRPR